MGSSANPVVVGQPVTFTAAVAPVPDDGTVRFADGGATIAGCDTQPVDKNTGQATCQTTYTSPGAHGITATYSGDSAFAGSQTQTALDQTVRAAATSTTLTANHTPSVYGQLVTFTATIGVVAPGAGMPTGTVSFTDGGAAIAGCTSQPVGVGTLTATCTMSALHAGPHSITASYSGDATFAASDNSAAPYSQPVNPAALTITASSATMTYGGSPPTITPTYTGLANGDTAPATPPTCGTTATSSSPAGAYPTSCSGAADPDYTISYLGGTLTITQAHQTITFGPLANRLLGNPPITISAIASSGLPVTFTAGPSNICTAGGTNGAIITLVGIGTCTVTASQPGSANYQAATPVAQQFTIAYPPLYETLTLTSSPSGPVTNGSIVTANFSLGNHTSTVQTIHAQVTLTYTGSKGNLSLSIPLTLKLNAGQTSSQRVGFTVTKAFPRGTYTLSVSAQDGAGDTANASTSLTIS